MLTNQNTSVPCASGLIFVESLPLRSSAPLDASLTAFGALVGRGCLSCFMLGFMLGLVLQEKSLGGLCRRFVQLFLVGNDVVSVAEAAEKLSDPSDVSGRARPSVS